MEDMYEPSIENASPFDVPWLDQLIRDTSVAFKDRDVKPKESIGRTSEKEKMEYRSEENGPIDRSKGRRNPILDFLYNFTPRDLRVPNKNTLEIKVNVQDCEPELINVSVENGRLLIEATKKENGEILFHVKHEQKLPKQINLSSLGAKLSPEGVLKVTVCDSLNIGVKINYIGKGKGLETTEMEGERRDFNNETHKIAENEKIEVTETKKQNNEINFQKTKQTEREIIKVNKSEKDGNKVGVTIKNDKNEDSKLTEEIVGKDLNSNIINKCEDVKEDEVAGKLDVRDNITTEIEDVNEDVKATSKIEDVNEAVNVTSKLEDLQKNIKITIKSKDSMKDIKGNKIEEVKDVKVNKIYVIKSKDKNRKKIIDLPC